MRQEFKQGEVIPGTRYRVLGLLGVGGMGSVYEVEHTELGKRFVLKALLSELAKRADLVARLRNEQRALGRLEHPCIVAVTDAGVTDADVPYFVMERLEGETLGARLKRQRRLPVIEAIAIAIGVLEGLAAAHEIGVVHRDIKPQNILLVGGIRPKILDFGVAKMADVGRAITARGVAVGTPRYMSPEQASGEKLDGRSDLYAVGLLLFESLVGHGPFDDARDANEMLLAHLGREVPRLSTRAQGITPELDQFVAGMLAKEPQSRPPTARAAASSLRLLALAYGPASEPGARALLGHATQPFGMPVAARPPAPTTHADGIAARHGQRAVAATDAANTLVKGLTGRPENTVIDDWGTQRGHETGSAFATTAAGIPSGEFAPNGPTRTEVLSAVGWPPRPSGTEETRTAVPLTPNDGSRTLHPAPERAGGARSRGKLVAIGAAALLVGGGGAFFALSPRAPTAGVNSALVAPAAPAVPTGAPSFGAARSEQNPGSGVALPAPTSLAPSASAALPGAPATAPAVASSSAEVGVTATRSTRPPAPRPPAPTKALSTARQAKSAAPASGSATKSAISDKKAAELRKVPSGLPGSGL